MLLYHGSLFTKALPSLRRPISSLVQRSLEKELTARRLPLAYDYLSPQASHLLQLSLFEHLPRETGKVAAESEEGLRRLPSVREQRHLPPGHHLVYFPPQVTLSELLRDGTDVLHAPGEPFHRRLWAGGNVVFPRSGSLILNGQRAVCVENISSVNVKGREGEEKIFVTIERRFSTVAEGEDESQLRSRLENNPSVLTETRDLVFLREPDLETRHASSGKTSRLVKSPAEPDISHRLTPNKALLFRFSALTFNAHLIHLDQTYTKNIEGHNDLLVHGPLSLTLMLSVLSSHLAKSGQAIQRFTYRNLAPLLDIMDVFWAAPPVARTLTALTCLESALVYGGLLNGYHIVFLPGQIFKLLPEVWRLATPFLLTKPQLSFLFDLYFMYTYSSGLEKNSPRFLRSGDFLTYVVFVGAVIMLLANFLFGSVIFTSALIMAFIHTWSQDNRGKQVHFYVVQIRAEWLPLALLGVNFVMAGPTAAMIEGTGIIASHLYDFLTRIWPTFGGGRNYITTPAFVHNLFDDSRSSSRGYGAAYRPAQAGQARQAGQAGQSSGASSSYFGSSWSTRGAGRRLGGN
ncbi:Derlin-1 [Talaromyces islandicus]|uniref:Derlin-1 n=1 Tax=Talaromyces islandicus TaxID=28573 RepID=A0A0U1M0L4_TALIS|nr:Derlin-1 [Talaromyces islandicus]